MAEADCPQTERLEDFPLPSDPDAPAPTPIPMDGEFLRFVLEGGSHAFVDELVTLVREYRLFREH